jgi:hypothetical protein
MHIFSIDIPFKGSQNLSNIRSPGTAVSLTLLCLAERVYDTGLVQPSQISDAPMTQRCQRHRCTIDFVGIFSGNPSYSCIMGPGENKGR